MNVARKILGLVFCLALTPSLALATNGDNLIGVGSISRAMGGVGIANPQDAVSAVFSNPAAMCFGGFCPSNEVDFMGTVFTPHIKADISAAGGSYSSHSGEKSYTMPAIGISYEIPEVRNLRFGLGAYATSGMGVDYRDRGIDVKPAAWGGTAPLASGTYTELGVMKFAPTVAYQFADWLSLGAAMHIDYSTLDMGAGTSDGYGVGGEFGVILKPHDKVNIGLTYITAQEVKYSRVADFDGDSKLDDLKLASPQQVGFGVSYTPIPKLLLETDVKWVNWSDAKGYKEFDWDDQWVFGVGVQYKPIDSLALRAGYNYGQNPVKKHTINGLSNVNVQGKTMNNYYYETFRLVGFPAIAEQHVTFGVGYDVSSRFAIHAGYMHAFSNSITETGVDITGAAARIKSTMSEDSYEFGLSWRF
ncbi:MAG: hypothetical protein AUJ49_09575 [Desulfovibrionaceae bacterium CG1_02_65_16]|nr:MAG: hypothetical protein AUJ49_09575 [Desulfovibrionaceae bacterium CG1_02_65_16]